MTSINHDVTSYFRCHLLVTVSLRISDDVNQPQCHSLFQMSFVNHDVTPYFQVSQGYQVAFGHSPTKYSMAAQYLYGNQ